MPPTKHITHEIARMNSPSSSPSNSAITFDETIFLKIPPMIEVVGTAKYAEDPGRGGPAQLLHGHLVNDLQKEFGRPKEKYAVVKNVTIREEFHAQPYPLGMKGADVPDTLADI